MRPATSMLVVAALLATAVGHAGQVVVDNSLGGGGSLSGPNYSITETGGRAVGNNLFHSFSQFNLDAGDVATFSGPVNIQNVISRVTGGSASMIDGTIRCDIAGANFFFINPFGVMFGPNAKVDVSGSFAVTTADYVKLADGGRFDARNPVNDVLTTAPVSEFGFLGSTPGSIRMQGPALDQGTPVLAELADGKSFLVVGGDLHIDNIQITAPSGRVGLIAVKSAGELSVDIDDLCSSIDTSSFPQLGDVELTTFATFDLSGDPGGRVDLQARNLTAHDLNMLSSSVGAEDGLGIDFNVRESISLLGVTFVYSEALDVGNAGALTMKAKSILMQGEPVTGSGPVNILTETFGPCRAGDINIQANSVEMRNGVLIAAGTASSGNGGNINVTANSILMAGQESTAVLSTTSFEGIPGIISINTDMLTLKADSQITAEAFGPSSAGTIQITARQVTIDDFGGVDFIIAGISVNSETLGVTSGLGAGDVILNVDTLSLKNGARISSSSATDSPGGNILINATHEISLKDSQISAHAGGDGGNVKLSTPSLVYLLDSQITAESLNGNGGNIMIDPQSVVLNKSALIASAIQGDGGNVNIVSKYFLQSASTIDVSSEFGLQGTVTISAPVVDSINNLDTLPEDLLEADTLLKPHCATRLPVGASTFVVHGRRGVPLEPGMLLPARQQVGGNDAH